jgi:hypothetical protein
MQPSFDPGALLAHSYRLPGGTRVCLRLARSRDLAGVADLSARAGRPLTELELARLVRPHPRRRIVICATSLLGVAETVVGVGAIDLGPEASGRPDTLIVDGLVGAGLDELILRALLGRASAISQTRSAARSRITAGAAHAA